MGHEEVKSSGKEEELGPEEREPGWKPGGKLI